MNIVHTRILLLIFLLCANVLQLKGQSIKGEIADKSTNTFMYGATIMNIYSNKGTLTDSSGQFEIRVNAGDLIEISKFGYQTIRLRIPKGALPSYYKLSLDLDYFDLDGVEIFGNATHHIRDSVKKADLYKEQLNLPKIEGFDVILHPFSALSKRNRQIWKFQKEYKHWEEEKFIDYVFNDEIILQLANISEKDLKEYKKMYRPTYEILKDFDNDYDFYEYLVRTGKLFHNNNSK